MPLPNWPNMPGQIQRPQIRQPEGVTDARTRLANALMSSGGAGQPLMPVGTSPPAKPSLAGTLVRDPVTGLTGGGPAPKPPNPTGPVIDTVSGLSGGLAKPKPMGPVYGKPKPPGGMF